MAQRHAPLTFPDRPRNLKIGDELGRGAWGVVYNGEFEGRPVAVKRIHELLHQEGSEEEHRKVLGDFREECKKLQAFSHPHVVGFIGSFNDPKLGPILVMEKMQENLREFLNRWKNKLPLPKQLRISLEIIRGVAFLHQQTPPLVHRDLNDKNVMFSFEGVIKIGDFGQSKLKKDLYLTTGTPGMVLFMPPEALKDHEIKYNESLDIFSVGVLMLEIGTQQEPLVNLYGIGTIREVERREKHLKALSEDHPLRSQILPCLKDNPKERPKASDLQREVLAMVDGSAKTLIRYVKQLQSMRKDLEQSRELEQKAKQDLTECIQQMQKEWESQEETVRRLKQQHQEEVDELNARVRSAEDAQRRWEASNQAVLAQKEEEKKHLLEKLDDALQEIGILQADVARRDANIKQLEERCQHLEAQASIYKQDFEQERGDRQDAMGRFDTEREEFQEVIAKLNIKMQAKHLEHDATVAQLEQLKELSVTQRKELKEKEERLQHTRGSSVGLEQKLSKLHTQHESLSKENVALRAQLKSWEKDIKAFKAIEDAYQKTFDEAKTYKELYRDAESKRAADASRVNELAMVVNAIEAKGHGDAGENVEALRADYQRLKTQFNALEAASKRVTNDKQQLAFAYQDLQKLYGTLQRENEALNRQQRVMATAPEADVASRDANIRQLEERCEQLEAQVNRESAHDKFADREKWMEEFESLTLERDRLTGNIFALKYQLVTGRRELEARTKEAAKESSTVKALEEEFGTVVAKKDEEIQRMTDLIRELQPIADQYKVLFAENRELQQQFDALLRTNHEVQQMLRSMQSEKAAADSRVKELTMVVGQLTAENEAFNQQSSQLTQQNETQAAKDGSKHPVLDQQEIDKQLPKAAAGATPEVLTFANISLKEPIVVTPKSVAPPVVIPEALLIDDDTCKPSTVMPEEPVIATPIVASAAPPKTAPSTIPKETPNVTPNDTPVAAPTSSIATPRAHVATPRVPVATPKVPVATSVAPVNSPSSPVAIPTTLVAAPRAPVATSVAHVDTPSAPHTMPKSPTVTTPKSPTTDSSASQQQQVDNKAFPRKRNIDQSEVGRQGPGKMNSHSPEQDPDTQDANMKDAPSCEKCGKIFPWNQRRLLWKHMQECTGSAESGESVSTPTPSVARSQTLPQSRYTGLSTTSRSSKSDTQAAATDEDAPKCEKCGRIFPWNQLQLRWKHKCEPTEVARAPDPPRRRVQSSASNLTRQVSVANMEELFTSSTVEVGVRSASDDATLTCKCGKIFAKNQRREFVIHKLQCREGTPPAPPSAGRHYRGATLPRQ